MILYFFALITSYEDTVLNDKRWLKTGVPLIFNIYQYQAVFNDKQQQQKNFSLLCFNYLQKYCNLT